MKRLMTVMLGMSLAIGSLAPAFAQEKKEGTEDTGKKKKGKKKKEGEEPKKDLR